jgi:hypothetical protein
MLKLALSSESLELPVSRNKLALNGSNSVFDSILTTRMPTQLLVHETFADPRSFDRRGWNQVLSVI